jgi:hypothetical protein
MAEILIKLEAATNPSDLLAWDRCLPVVVFEDGHPWGSLERPPKFLVVRITDQTATQAQQYMEEEYDTSDPPVQITIRKWKFDIDDSTMSNPMKRAVANAIADGTILQVTTAMINAYIKRTT